MGLKTFTINFAEYTKHQYLRFDEKFWYTTKNIAVYDFILLKNVFNLVNGNSYTEYYTEEKTDIPYIRIGDLTFRFEIDDKNLIYLDDSIELSENKILKEDDLILATIGATIGKINLARDFKGGTFSNNTILLRLKDKKNHNPLFYEKLFQTSLLQKYIWGVISQKAQPNLQTYDLENVKIPLIAKPKQDQIVAQIEPIEKKIKELKSQIKPPQEVINKVFAREFGFDLDKFEENKKEKFFEVDFSKISKNNLTRVSSHFHHIKLNFLEDKLKDKDHWISLNIKFKLSGGKRVPKGKTFSNEPTDYFYLRPTEVNIWGIDKNNVLYISEEIYNQLKRYKIRTGEFCISIVGTLGKTALIDTEELEIEDDNLILSENFIKLTPTQKINDLFYYYFFYSFIFEAQMDREYTVTSIKKLGIDKWSYIKIPNISLEEQQKIVDEIKAELDKQEEIRKLIEIERNKIDEIVEKAII